MTCRTTIRTTATTTPVLISKDPAPYPKRFLTTVGTILGAFFGLVFDYILPVAVAIVLILGFCFVCFTVWFVVAQALGFDVGVDAERKRVQEGEKRDQGEGQGQQGSDGGAGEKGEQNEVDVDEKTRLRVEIRMLEENLRVRREKLAELDKKS